MPRVVRKRAKKAQPTYESFVFEIGEWESSYILSVNSDRRSDDAYWEHLSIKFKGVCVHPEALKGRVVDFDMWGRRDTLRPEMIERNPDWRPLGIGELETHPSRGSFHFAVPQGSMQSTLTAFAHGLYRFVYLWGSTLKRGKSLCQSVHFMKSVDLQDL